MLTIMIRPIRFERIFFWILTLVLCGCQSEEASRMGALKAAIEKKFSSVEGDFALALMEIEGKKSLLYVNEKEMFHAASTMKTPVMIEVYKQAALGGLAIEDSILVKNTFYSIVDSSTYSLNPEEDSEQTLYSLIGQPVAVGDLAYKMIIESSNLATNLLIEYVGAQNCTQTMRNLGAPTIEVLRGVEDSKAYQKGLNNVTSAYDQLMIYEKLAKGKVVTPAACDSMIAILMDQRFKDIIPARLPAEVKVAHKTGWITGVHHDAGIVFLPDGRKYVLVLLSKNVKDSEKAINMLATVSELVYHFMTNQPLPEKDTP